MLPAPVRQNDDGIVPSEVFAGGVTPGELPIWGTLALCTTAAAALLLASVPRA
jgi:hypothetical protein